MFCYANYVNTTYAKAIEREFAAYKIYKVVQDNGHECVDD
jgi:hypothetical protein